ncbi:MAG: ABC transporter ATP-binding protein [Gemmatimonadetes bacterium]|nr:ABC transporter ATP-binding protein [Gemmatimonadota bacterium]
MTLLDVRDLRVAFPGAATPIHPVDGVSFRIDRGETLALVGESGCGKSLTALALLQLVPRPGVVADGSVQLGGLELTSLQGEALRAVRGRRIGMVFQDPLTSLNPVLTVGSQVAEGLVAHGMATPQDAARRAVELLKEVGVADAEERANAYPHQMSGGMRQRVGIAIALAAEPEVLIADEPTTALDVTVQAQILELIDRLRKERGMAVLLITHDLGVVAGRADRVAVMYAGQIVEEGRTPDLFAAPSHPYTRGLLASVPRLTGALTRLSPIPGTVPPPAQWPPACRFEPRCGERFAKCAVECPTLLAAGADHTSRCWLMEKGR